VTFALLYIDASIWKRSFELIWHNLSTTLWRRVETGGIAPRIVNIGVGWRWVIFIPRPLYPRLRAPDTHWICGWVGSRADLNVVAKREIPVRIGNRIQVVQPIPSHYTCWNIPVISMITLKSPSIYDIFVGLSHAVKILNSVCWLRHKRKWKISGKIALIRIWGQFFRHGSTYRIV